MFVFHPYRVCHHLHRSSLQRMISTGLLGRILPAFISSWHGRGTGRSSDNISSESIPMHEFTARRTIPYVFRITDHLGSGQFGWMEKGVWHSLEGPVEVAIKTLRAEASEEERVKFLQEAAIIGQFHHPNIVKLHGVVTVGEPVSNAYSSIL